MSSWHQAFLKLAVASAAEHVARIEIDDDVLPGLVFRDRQEAVGRAACAPRATRSRPRPGTPDGCRGSSAAARPASEPSCLNWMRTVTIRSRASATPTGTFQHCAAARAARRSRSATASRRVPVAVPSDGVLLSVSPVAALALRVALVEQRRDAARVELRLRLRRLGLLLRRRRLGLLLRLRIGLLGCPSSAPRRSDRLRLRLLGEGLLRLGLGLAASASAASARPSSARAASAAAADRRSRRSPACSRPPWRSCPRPASPRRPSRPAASASRPSARSWMPCVICEKSVAEMMSVGMNSGGGALSGLAGERRRAPTPARRACSDRRYGPSGLHRAQEPCSTSVTSATRRKPAAESRPITRITVP